VEIRATVVYVLADERNSSYASIVGLRIDKISGRTQTLLMNYLHEIN